MINENKNKNENLININTDTLNATEFNFDAYFEIFPERRSEEHYKFLCWFVGFFESNGSLFVSKEKHFALKICSREHDLLNYIKEQFTFGKVYFYERKPAKLSNYKLYEYRVTVKPQIAILIKILNGNLKLNKSYKELQTCYNIFIKHNLLEPKVSLLPQQTKISLNNSWLTGFIDGDGCFCACLYKYKQTKSGWNFNIYLKLIQQDAFLIFDKIRKLFNSNSKVYIQSNNNFVIKINAISCLEILINYLESFELKTNSKKISFLNWKELLPYTKQELLYTTVQNKEQFSELQKKVKNINAHSTKSPYFDKNLNKKTNE